jgi:DNA mismatch repair ATPase MutS
VEIGSGLSECYDNFHFADEVGSSGLDFDYRIKPGVVKTRNAVKLLRYLGYPDIVLDELDTEEG